MGGQTVSWSLAGYFEALESRVEQDLGEHSPEGD